MTFHHVRLLLQMVRFSHTLFALPPALLGAVMAWTTGAHRDPPVPFRPRDLAGILVCIVFARTAAMALNRLADRRLDALNPRTAMRHLPTGALSVGSVVVFTVACSLGFVAGTLLFLNRQTAPQPRILIEPMEWDLGQVVEGETYAKTFKICNKGNALLIIEDERPSCSCDSAILSTKEVAPHGCALLDVTFDSTDRTGQVEAWVYVVSNDPRQEFLKIMIHAEVLPRQ